MRHATRKPRLTEHEQMRFGRRIPGTVLVTAVSVHGDGVQSTADMVVTEPALYRELCRYAFWRAGHLVGEYRDAHYMWMTCSLRNVGRFRTVFRQRWPLAQLFLSSRGQMTEIRFSFPEIPL